MNETGTGIEKKNNNKENRNLGMGKDLKFTKGVEDSYL